MKGKHIPQRLCIVCGTMKSKGELYRLVKLPEGTIRYDANSTMAGKGIYLCRQKDCLETFIANKKFKKRFHSSLDEATLATLKCQPELLVQTAPEGPQGKIVKEG